MVETQAKPTAEEVPKEPAEQKPTSPEEEHCMRFTLSMFSYIWTTIVVILPLSPTVNRGWSIALNVFGLITSVSLSVIFGFVVPTDVVFILVQFLVWNFSWYSFLFLLYGEFSSQL
jgi:hypothetical protein